MPEAFPFLRSEIDAAPAEHDGGMYYILYDRTGLTTSRLMVSPIGLLVASHLDGQSSVLDIFDRLSDAGGGVSCSDVEEIVKAFSNAMFLEDPAFNDFREQVDRDFRAAPLRTATSAGSAYPDEAAELASELDRMLAEAPQPEETLKIRAGGRPDGMIVPHIDFFRGGPGYGQAYKLLSACPPPETVIVVGTAHLTLKERFAICEKDFQTPLGNLSCDLELAEKIRRAAAPYGDIRNDLLAHRGEHSVELQAVWLRHIWGEGVKIVPLLAASLGDFEEAGTAAAAMADPVLKAVAEAIGEAAASGRVMVMASADLSHVGPRFGDEREVNGSFLAEVEAFDRDYLAGVAQGGAAEGVKRLAAAGDRYHVCGSASIFTLGLALPTCAGKLLGYHQAATPEMQQAVTYASMAFKKE